MKKFLFIFLLFIGFLGFGQEKKAVQDSISRDSIKVERKVEKKEVNKDSTEIYKDLKKYTEKSKVGKQLHKWLFREPKHGSKKSEEPEMTYYGEYAGRTIRDVAIETRDPFGYSVDDTTKVPHSWFQKAGNAVHAKSKPMAIKKYFLFKEGEEIDTFLINESARLLRQQSYVRDVRILPVNSEDEKDSLDLEVWILDSWSLLPKVRVSGSNTMIGLKERNFFGMGHEAELHYGKRYEDGNTGFETSYKIPNIKNSFVNVQGRYTIDYDHFYDRYLMADRKFYSTLTRWAGGLFFQERFLERPLQDEFDEFEDVTFKYRYQNYWGAYAIPLFKADQQKTDLIFSLRSSILNYKRTPDDELDRDDFFSDERFYLGSIGLSSRNFVQDFYIFRDGETEDVPIGSLYSITAGSQNKNHRSRLYLGAQASYGTYFHWGFLASTIEFGSFFNSNSAMEQTTLSLKLNYFSNILDLGGNWKMRQFVKPQMVLGFKRLDSYIDRLGLNDNPYYTGIHSYEYLDYGDKRRYIDYKNGNIEGFDSYSLGTQKFVVEFQTQFYAPWELFGFRLNPFFNLGLGYLAGKKRDYQSDKLYSSVGLGVIVRNDYLVFNSFQLSLAYYPQMPGEGNSVFKTNAYRAEDFGFQDFQPDQPRTVIYE